MSRPEEIVVRVVRGTCADEETYPAVTRVEHDEQWRYVIGEPVSDPAILAERKQPWLDRLRSERERGLQRSRHEEYHRNPKVA